MAKHKALAYVRCSVGDKHNGSMTLLTSQIAAVRAYCAARDIEIVATYQEKVSSGALLRPQLDRMVAHAMSPRRPVDRIIVHSPSRLSRDPRALTRTRTSLAVWGVTIVSAT